MADKHLTLKEYIQSKHVLLDAANDAPRKKHSYTVTKYCKLKINESDTTTKINLKPKDEVVILWEYTEWHEPIIIDASIVINGEPSGILKLSWSDEKMRKWIDTNTKTKFDNGTES